MTPPAGDVRPDAAGLNTFLARPALPADGITLGVKDLIDTAGLATTYGSAIFGDHVPDRSAPCVTRLEAAGYAVVGKTNLHEFAYGTTSENPHFGAVRNPLDPERIAGGSSGGSAAALAAGLCDAALGTDSAGSVRIPAACCGVVGFRPTRGQVSTEGVFPLAPSFDVVGPMARTMRECAEIQRALVGSEPARLELGELRVGIAWLEHADPLVRSRIEAAAAPFGTRVDVDLPLPKGHYPVFMREAADVHRELFANHRDLYGDDVRQKLERAFAVTDEEVRAADRVREGYRDLWAEALNGLDLLVTPTLPSVAPRAGLGDLAIRDTLTRLTYPASLAGAPALALPCGLAEDGLPASVQLLGSPGDDALVLGAGLALEAALGSLDRGRT